MSQKASLTFCHQSVSTYQLFLFPVDEGIREACGHSGQYSHCLRQKNRPVQKGVLKTIAKKKNKNHGEN